MFIFIGPIREVMRAFHFLTLGLLFNVFLFACANRGFYLSQQMPGVDKDLNLLPENSHYVVNEQGDILEKKELASLEKTSQESSEISSSENKQNSNTRGLSSIKQKPIIELETTFVPSTLDPAHGAALLGY